MTQDKTHLRLSAIETKLAEQSQIIARFTKAINKFTENQFKEEGVWLRRRLELEQDFDRRFATIQDVKDVNAIVLNISNSLKWLNRTIISAIVVAVAYFLVQGISQGRIK